MRCAVLCPVSSHCLTLKFERKLRWMNCWRNNPEGHVWSGQIARVKPPLLQCWWMGTNTPSENHSQHRKLSWVFNYYTEMWNAQPLTDQGCFPKTAPFLLRRATAAGRESALGDPGSSSVPERAWGSAQLLPGQVTKLTCSTGLIWFEAWKQGGVGQYFSFSKYKILCQFWFSLYFQTICSPEILPEFLHGVWGASGGFYCHLGLCMGWRKI